jgi:methanogenic corrinoid protein MtbC1
LQRQFGRMECSMTVATPPLDAYLDAALAGDRTRCLAIAREALAAGMPIKTLYTDIFQAAQYRIGELWQTNRITVGVEHLATATTQAVLAALYEYVVRPDGHGRPVLMACPPSERHEMGPRMMADFAEMAGFDVTYLGPAGVEAIADAARRLKPEAIGLSATLATHLPQLTAHVAGLKAALGAECPTILVGGRALSLAPDSWPLTGADAYAATPDEAVAYLEGLQAS